MSSKLNLRRRPRISYYEPEEPNLDEYVFCSECGDFVFEYCAIHGPLLVVPDDKVPKNPNVPSYVPRAALAIPHVFLHLAYSTIPGAGLGVFTTLTLPHGVRFGPYRGKKSYDADSSYCWQIHDGNGRPSHMVDAADANSSNWMRYVNCARHWLEQNLVAYQYRGHIYYRTIKIIPKFTELMVFYGSEFAINLGVDLRKYNSPSGYAQKLGALLSKKSKTKVRKENVTSQHVQKPKSEDSTVNSTLNCMLKKPLRKNDSIELKNLSAKKRKIYEDTEVTTLTDGNIKLKPNETLGEWKTNKTVILSDNKINKKQKYASIDITIEQTQSAIQINENVTSILNNSSNGKDNLNGSSEDIMLKKFNVEPANAELHQTDICNKYDSHSEINTEGHKLSCDICTFKTQCEKTLITHLHKHIYTQSDRSATFICDYCRCICNNKNNLLLHIKSHSEISENYTRNTPCSEATIAHEKAKYNDKLYFCKICDTNFLTKSTLSIHDNTHTQEKLISNNLISHKRLRTGEKPFACDVCDMKFTQKGSIISHKRMHTGEKPFACDVCDMKFTQKGNIISHKRLHTGEKPFACDVCDMKFTRKGNIISHKRLHTGEKPFACDVCDMKFTRRGNIISHKRLHTGEKPFACDVCDMKFTRKDMLISHKRMHTGEKPFACDVCDMKFTRKDHLVSHKRLHTGEKPFACDVCDMKFTRKNMLISHKRMHTGEKSFTCDMCNRKFSCKRSLRMHTQIHISKKLFV